MTITIVLDRLPGLDAACRVHPDEPKISERIENWVVARGLMPRAQATQARFGALACRAFPESEASVAVLCGQWLAWFCASDDVRDGDFELGWGAIDQAYAELWEQTAPRTGPTWVQRFTAELDRYRRSETTETLNRRTHRMPSVSQYEAFRRTTNGMFLFLLPEPLLGVEVPQSVVDSAEWRTLTEAADDVVAWTNDLASLHRDGRSGDTTNYVLVLEHGLGISRHEAVSWVCDRVATRMTEMQTAARSLPAEFDRQKLDRATAHDVSKVAMTLLSAPRAHLEWLRESGRYLL